MDLRKITSNFKINEFSKVPDFRAVYLLQELRIKYNKPIYITAMYSKDNKDYIEFRIEGFPDSLRMNISSEISYNYPVYGNQFIIRNFDLFKFNENFPLNLKAVIVGLYQLGYKEGPNNDTYFGKFFNLNNQPWCAMFLAWCWTKAGIVDEVYNGFASTSLTYNLLPYKCNLQKTITGDGLFYKKGHTGLVLFNDIKKELIYTLEGNLGDAVKIKIRNYDTFKDANELYGCGNWKKYSLNINPINERKLNEYKQTESNSWS